MFRIACLAFLLALAGAPDLDVGVPPGSPLDFIRTPVASPRFVRKDVSTPAAGAGTTVVAENPVNRPPHKPVPLSRPLTLDFEAHLNWKPAAPSGTATGGGALAGYPPAVPRELYIHGICFYLMLLLHEDQVSPREIICYLIELGEPAAYAATAVRVEEPLRAIADHVIAAGGQVPGTPPRPSKVKLEDDIARDLVVAFPYEDRFGTEFLQLPSRTALPVLLKFAQSKAHSFLARNAVYALRLYDEEDALPALRTLVKSSDKVIRNRALAALMRWQDPEIVPWLIDQLDSPDVPFRTYALHALGKIGDRRAVDPILKAAKAFSGDWEFLWGALAALARLRDSKDEVTTYLGRVPAIVNRMNLPDLRRQILLERVRIASATGGNQAEQKWMRTAKVQDANRRLVEEWTEFELQAELAKAPPKPPAAPPREPAPAPKPAPPAPPPPPPPAVRSPAELALAAARGRLVEYTGVRSVRAEQENIILDVSTEADAADLHLLLGTHLNGVPLVIQTAR